MPRKIKPTPNPLQNRQNQARSRARRKAYIADLEARIRAFETKGVEATQEMQRAAREVARVNGRLLELLALKGVPGDEVEGWLRGERAGEPGPGEGKREGGGKGTEGGEVCSGAGGNESSVKRCERGSEGTERQTEMSPTGKANEPSITICDGTTNEKTDGSRALVTSCDDAASIIADFQGHGDVLRVRKVLGCGDARECHVKNTRLFQLMDETG